ncbi:MAG: hypothetical protein L0Y78_02330 [candidate division NC10 bacterium]|nr:hypothetical protein [candidate division NC10 bacterium]
MDRLLQHSVRRKTIKGSAKYRGIGLAGHHQDWGLPDLWLLQPVLEEAPPIHDRHLQVQEDDIRRLSQAPNESVGSVAGLYHGKASEIENIPVSLPDKGIIVDNQDGKSSFRDDGFLQDDPLPRQDAPWAFNTCEYTGGALERD